MRQLGSLRASRADRVATWGPSVLAALQTARDKRPDVAASGVAALWDSPHGKVSAAVGVWFHGPDDDRPHALTLGKHRLCDLAPVAHAAQRHAVILLWPPGVQRLPRVELIDFLTGTQVGAGGAARLDITPGACRFSLAMADLVVLQAPAGRTLFLGDPARAAARLTVAPPAVALWGADADGFDGGEPTEPDRLALARPETTIGFVDDDGAARDLYGALLYGETPPARVKLADRALDHPVLLGRHQEAATRRAFEHARSVSRIHACLLARRDGLWIVDCASHNGTEIVCRRTKRRVALGPGARAHRLGPFDDVFLGDRQVLLDPGPRAQALLYADNDVVAPISPGELRL